MDIEAKKRELDELRRRVSQLEAEIAQTASDWPPKDFYSMYYATTGFMLGAFGAVTSLLVNAIFAPLAGKSPLELIKVYLTFPMGEKALEINAAGNGWLILSLGVCLYIGTGMLLGVPFYLQLVRICGKQSPLRKRLIAAVLISLQLWVIAFYCILSWVQPLLLGGNWITDPTVLPPWVAAGTHLVFGVTLALLYPLGQFTPYTPPTPQTST